MIVTENVAETVLIVEDDPLLRCLLAGSLSTEGFYVIEASTGAEAIHLLQALPGAVEWLVTDLNLAGACSGFHVALEYRFTNPLRTVIFIAGGEIDPRLLQLPDVQVFRKPVTPTSVIEFMLQLREERVAL